jgi:transglutaminase 1
LTKKNEKVNNTAVYDTDKLVLRRGNDFSVRFILSRAFDKKTDALNVEFRRGSNPQFREGTRFECLVERRAVREWEWKGTIDSSDGKMVTASLHVPVDAPIGEYEMVAEAVDLDTKKQDTREADRNAVILFNPWDKDDDVYIEDDRARQEYVLNGSGKIWAGSSSNTFTWSWEFQQFESYSLNSALYLLDRFGLNSELRRSPVHVSRTCATMVNANDNDGGILFGNWSGKYHPYTPPSAWSGSGAILEQYWKTKEVVKYAQCWVFGGTLTSVLRALGIPCRPVTNFVSAHDTDASRSIDYYFDSNHEEMPNLCSDSLWSYHVWIEGWMERPDLKGAYGGWQALDATPQVPIAHSAGGVFTLGPAPVAAIKEGKDMKFDTDFITSEVSAEVCYHLMNADTGMFTQVKTNTSKAGKMMLTKAVGSPDSVDIMSSYKYPEYSLEERAALKAGLLHKQGSDVDSEGDDDGDFEEEDEGPPSELDVEILPPNDVCIGQDMTAILLLKSSSRKYRTVRYSVKVSPVIYTGRVGDLLVEVTQEKKLGPNETCEIPIEVTVDQYLGLLKEQYLLNIAVFVACEELDYVFMERETCRFTTPDIDVKLPGDSFKVGETVEVSASFKNPLDTELLEVEWYVEGSTLIQSKTIMGEQVPPNEDAIVTFQIVPRTSLKSEYTLSITFQSHKLSGVTGSAAVKVTASAGKA